VMACLRASTLLALQLPPPATPRKASAPVPASATAPASKPTRRDLGRLALGAALAGTLHNKPGDALAGLVQFPPEELNNTYYLVRAGESQAEGVGVLYTNPVGKTATTSGLSETGYQQVLRTTLPALREVCEEGCWLWPSITQRSYQTAEVISSELGIMRSRIVPEYSFLDARGLGTYEGRPLEDMDAVHAQDRTSQFWRPNKTYDGTPSESVEDVLVRVRQLMSILETQYGPGEVVVIISPDSENLSVLEAGLVGLDLREHASLAYSPGEVRRLELPKYSSGGGWRAGESVGDAGEAEPGGGEADQPAASGGKGLRERPVVPNSIPCPNPPSCRP